MLSVPASCAQTNIFIILIFACGMQLLTTADSSREPLQRCLILLLPEQAVDRAIPRYMRYTCAPAVLRACRSNRMALPTCPPARPPARPPGSGPPARASALWPATRASTQPARPRTHPLARFLACLPQHLHRVARPPARPPAW